MDYVTTAGVPSGSHVRSQVPGNSDIVRRSESMQTTYIPSAHSTCTLDDGLLHLCRVDMT